MSIQHCPDEVLDMFFQLLPFQSPDKAPTTLLHTLLTCRRFCAIARRHLIRVVCLESEERVNLFAAYLTQLTNAGTYGSALLPIEHLAACGNYIPQGSYSRSPEREAQRAAELILPFIISIAAPSIRSLTIFGFISQVTREVDGRRVENIVESSVRFPKLQWLVLLDQNIIRPYHGQVGYRFPRLTSLYTDRDCIGHDLLALDTLREFRLDMLRSSYKTSVSFLQDLRVETFIIDATPHHYFWGGTQSMHQEWVESFHEFVKASSSSSESSVIVAKATCIRPKLVLGAWGDIVQGGSGYWKKGWRPTTAYGTRIEEFEVERLLVIKLTDTALPAMVVNAARLRGLLLPTAGGIAVRLVPSLNVQRTEVDFAMDIIESVLGEVVKKP